jgi:hypothetical protein
MADGGTAKQAPAKKATASSPPTTKAPRWRRIVGAILVILGCILVPLSVSAVWVRNTLLDTDNYVETVAPLADNKDVQEALATNITNAIYTQVDVEAEVKDALGEVGPRAEVLAAPIAAALQNLTHKLALEAFKTDQFQTLWEQANRRVHTRLDQVLTGGGPNVSTKNGDVTINIENIFEAVKAKLDDRGISLFDNVTLPKGDREFTLIKSDALEQAQSGVDLLQTIAFVLPVVLVLLFAGAILLSSNRRRTVLRAAIGVAIASGIQLVLLGLGRNLYLDAIRGPKRPGHAAAAIWDQLTEFLRLASETIFVLAILIAIVTWVMGPAKTATRVRGWSNRAFGAAGASADAGDHFTGSIAGFFSRHKNPLRVVGLVVAILVLIIWNHPTPELILVVGAILLIWLAIVEFLGRGTSAEVST